MDPIMHRIIFPFGIALLLFAALTFRFRKRKLERYFFGFLALICLVVTAFYFKDTTDTSVQVTGMLIQEEAGFYREPGYRDLHFTVTETGEKISVCVKKKEAELFEPDKEYVLRYAKNTRMLISWYDPNALTEESTTQENPTGESTTDENASTMFTFNPTTQPDTAASTTESENR